MANIKDLLKQLTLKEKIGQLNLLSYSEDIISKIETGEVGSLLNVYGHDLIHRLQEAAGRSPHRIPLLIGDDVIHGFKTTFPVPLAESCSFNLDLMEETARLSTVEAANEGINWIYAPMIDITNDPRWGRIMETSGEDPYLTSEISQRRVRGIQKTNRTAACAKHYLGYGASEAGIDYLSTDFSEHKMRQFYLRPFKAAIDEGVKSIMHSFGTYNGLPITMSKFLLWDVLRKECGFENTLVTDWQCLRHLENYHLATRQEAAEIGLRVGIDMDLNGKVFSSELEKAISENPELEKLLDDAVFRVLKMKQDLGLFENPFADYTEGINGVSREHARISAEESLLLFKNEKNLLPLAKNTRLLVVGMFNKDQDIHLGAWSCKGRKENVISLKQGIETEFSDSSFVDIDPDLSKNDWDKLYQKIDDSDCILLALGEPRSYSGENNCRQSLDLPFSQDVLIEKCKRRNKPLIGLVMAGRPLIINDLHQKADALLYCFHLGCEAGNAIARTLSGNTVPSAKTTVTFPKALGQIPIYYNRSYSGRDEIAHYLDGDLDPLYPFGFGLSYSKFIYQDFDFEYRKEEGILVVQAKIENVSDYTGKEIVQVYLNPSWTVTLTPKKELIGFQKVTVPAHSVINAKIEMGLDGSRYRDSVTIQVGPSSTEGIFKKLPL